jgi:hypothetical protein
MSEYSIRDFRINGERYYLVEKENKVSFYTTNIAAARYWIRSEMNDPTLIRPFQAAIPPSESDAQKNEESNGTKPEVKTEALEESQPTQEAAVQDAEAPKKPVRIS